MCGRYTASADARELADDLDALDDTAGSWRPAYSIAPSQQAPVLSSDPERGRVLTVEQWGVTRPPSVPGAGVIINAKIEKLDGSFWRPAFYSRRFACPMNGWYEWVAEGKAKIPHYLYSGTLLTAVGLYQEETDAAGNLARRFIIITREAVDASGDVHTRMPAFLSPDALESWLDDEPLKAASRRQADVETARQRRTTLLEELKASSTDIASSIRTHVVDRKVNNVRTVDPYDPTDIAPIAQTVDSSTLF